MKRLALLLLLLAPRAWAVDTVALPTCPASTTCAAVNVGKIRDKTLEIDVTGTCNVRVDCRVHPSQAMVQVQASVAVDTIATLAAGLMECQAVVGACTGSFTAYIGGFPPR